MSQIRLPQRMTTLLRSQPGTQQDMMFATQFKRRVSQDAPMLPGIAAVALALIVGGAHQAPSQQSNVAAPVIEVTNKPLPALPVVSRPPAAQPAIGLPTDTHLNKTPPRATKGLDLVKLGWTYNCMECHKLFPAKWHYDRPMNEHKDIHLDHGNNRFCLNCHHPTNRNAFVDYDGAEIAQADVVKLCAKCHGTIYRDWQAGVHGRQNGYWKANMGEKTRLRCIQCHDPHSPKFKAMQPLPPLRYPPRAAGGGDASSPHGEHDAPVASPHAPGTNDLKAGAEGVATTPERRMVASTTK